MFWGNKYGLLLHKAVKLMNPEQNGRHPANGIFRCIFLKENGCILIEISLKFVLQGPIDDMSPLVQVMAWCHQHNVTLTNVDQDF